MKKGACLIENSMDLEVFNEKEYTPLLAGGGAEGKMWSYKGKLLCVMSLSK